MTPGLIRSRTFITALFALSFAQSDAAAQQEQLDLRSALRAKALLDDAVAAHGGEARLRGLKDLSINMHGRRWMMHQSKTNAPPWDTQRTTTDMVLDFAGNRMKRYSVSRYPVDFEFAGTNISTPQGGLFFDPTRAGFGDNIVRFPAQPAGNSPMRRELPALQLLIARDRPETLRFAGRAAVDGQVLQGVSYAEPNGAVYTMWLDSASQRLIRLDWLRDDAVDGDVNASYTYSGYRMEKGIPVPSRLVERRNGTIVRDDTMTIAIDSSPADSVFAAPKTGYAEGPPPQPSGPEAEPVRKLAENVWLLQQLPGGNRVMFVAFSDHVLVFEAPTPQNAATAVMDAVRRTVPGKPVRYVTFSHHHDDHGGGLRPYISQGITIVTTGTNQRFVEHVAKARHTLRPDALSAAPKAPVIEVFKGKRVFSDGSMTVELHEIAPTSHVDEMVVAYFPNEKLLFQGDMLIMPDRGTVGPANQLTMDLNRAIERLGLDVRTIAGVHGPVGTIDDLKKAVSLRR